MVAPAAGLQEAAILEWELKGREAASGAVAGGLQELLRAADGREGNAGVVDLMLRYGGSAASSECLTCQRVSRPMEGAVVRLVLALRAELACYSHLRTYLWVSCLFLGGPEKERRSWQCLAERPQGIPEA